MTVKEVIQELQKYPENMNVFMDFDERVSDFTFGSVERIETREIAFKEDPKGPALAFEENVVLSEG